MKYFLIALLLVPGFVFGQGGSVQIPNVVPPSPQALGFMKYIDYPVNLTTGVPEVNVPIYTISSKELSLPISLSYHSSGFKPNEKDGIVGQNWILNAGGRISRTINNAPDEKNLSNEMKDESEFPRHCDFYENGACQDIESDEEAYFLLHEAGQGALNEPEDAEYDVFYYNFPGQAGKFIFERNEQFLFKPVILPFKPINIKTYGTSKDYNNSITHFEIVDENGVYYRFGRSVGTTNNITEKSESFDLYGRKTRASGVTSWLLTEIISSDKTDTISFEYTLPSFPTVENHCPFYKSISQTVGAGSSSWSSVNTSGMTSYSKFTYTEGKISRIKFKNGYVKFSYHTDPKVILDKIEVYNIVSANPIKTIKFESSPYVAGSSHWYKLDAVKYEDRTSSEVQDYSFLYYPDDSPYGAKTFPTMKSVTLGGYTSFETYSVDNWGFYNGAENDMLLAKADPSDSYSTHPYLKHLFGTADRTPDPDYAKVGVLRQITYPTGGTTTYEYEGNKTGFGVLLGGLRVKKIVHSTGGESLAHSYAYEASVSSVGEPVSIAYKSDCFKSFNCTYTSSGQAVATYTNSASPQLDYNLNGQPATYYRVIEYFGDDQINTGKIEYIYDMEPIMSNSDIVPDRFPSYDMRSYYPWFGLSQLIDMNFGGTIFYQKNYKYGQIFEKQKVIYDADGNLRKKIESNYSHELKNTYSGLYAKQIYESSQELVKNHYFWKKSYNIQQLSQKLDNVIVTEYPDNSGLTVVSGSSYIYNSNNFPSEKVTGGSNGEYIKTTFTYPNDEPCSSCSAMVTGNVLTPVVTMKEYLKTANNERLLKTYRTNYDQYGKALLLQTAVNDDPLVDEVSYTYNSVTQNLTSVKKAHDVNTSYLWSYNQTYPIAKVINATSSEIAFTSFENGSNEGNWTFNFVGVDYGKTGRKSHTNGVISKANLPQGNYVVSFWAKQTVSSNPKVTVGNIVSNLTTADWEYFEVSLYNITSTSVIPNNVYLDDLRIFPADARMTTYTYDPLVGMTSQSDNNGVITYYEYDDFQRLQGIKDHEENVVNSLDYHYKVR